MRRYVNAEETRGRIVERIRTGSKFGTAPSELETDLSMSASTVRHQLAILMGDGVVVKIQRGLYGLSDRS